MLNRFFKKNIIDYVFIFSIIFLFSLNITSAEFTENVKIFGNNLNVNLFSVLNTLLISSAVLSFLYGVIIFLLGRYQKNEKNNLQNIENGKVFMKWGLVALFLILSISGIIKLFQEELDINNSNTLDISAVSFKMGDPN